MPREPVECPHCGHEKIVWLHGGEIRAGTTCPECGDPFEIDLDQFN